jgi:hypothetical protein
MHALMSLDACSFACKRTVSSLNMNKADQQTAGSRSTLVVQAHAQYLHPSQHDTKGD